MQPEGRSATYVPAGEGSNVWILGQLLTFKLHGQGAGVGVFQLVTPPGGGAPPHLHYTQEETHYVLSGRYAFQCADQTIDAGPGAVIHVPAGVVHSFTNIGSEPGEILFIETPAGPLERFLEAIGEPVTDPAAPQGLPPDMAKLIATAERIGGIEFVDPGAAGG